jgi:hypothetical protein
MHDPTYRAALPVVAESLMPDLGRLPSEQLTALALDTRNIVVSYPEGRLRSLLGPLLQATVSNGIRGVLASRSLLALPAVSSASRFAPEGLVVVDAVAASGPPMRLQVPTLVLLDHSDPPQLSWLAATQGPLRIVVLPASTCDPMYPDDLVKDVRSPHWAIEDFLRRL